MFATVAMIMKEMLNSNKCAKKNENKKKENYKYFLSIFRSLTRELNPTSKRGLPTAMSMSCTIKQH
jgi:hypothetical protein